MMRATARALVLAIAAAGALGLGALVLALPAAAPLARAEVDAQLHAAGVSHPVTAVLLNFRAWDTLLEIGVLLAAALSALALRDTDSWPRAPALRPDPVLHALLRVTVPLAVLLAGYLLWAGASRPGGAFQAGAVLAGAGLLLHLAGTGIRRRLPARVQRALLAGGFAGFLAVSLGVTVTGANLLQYPAAAASGLILAIEAALTISIAATLIGLFLAGSMPRR